MSATHEVQLFGPSGARWHPCSLADAPANHTGDESSIYVKLLGGAIIGPCRADRVRVMGHEKTKSENQGDLFA